MSASPTSLTPVILAGGSGKRLWPLSRAHRPKQFLPLLSDRSMLQETVARLDGLPTAPAIVLGNEEHRFLVAEQLRQQHAQATIVLEPEGRNTAPAIAVAALLLARAGHGERVMLVLPADHLFADAAAFRTAVARAAPAAAAGRLVTFGIVPTAPATGYGYIRTGAAAGDGLAAVGAFVEKPDRATAERFLSEGGYHWNGGIFMFTADRFLDELGRHRPDILSACARAVDGAAADGDFQHLDAAAFAACPAESVDVAVFEATADAVVAPLDAGWSDVGSWSALWAAGAQDADGNVVRGDVLVEQSANCLLRADHRLVAALGLQDLVVVETTDAVLVAAKNRAHEVDALVARLAAADRSEHLHPREVHRPWGRFDSLELGERHRVKRIVVDPGQQLSLQRHRHRAEHWVVVQGTAKVTVGDRTFLLQENEHAHIPQGAVHRLENPGDTPLQLIEVQLGGYLGEDDIERLEDRYGRV